MCRRLVCLISLFLMLAVASNVSAELVAHWKFDDGAGNTATDSIDNAHPGTIGGTANWVAGQAGNALDFDGSTNYVDIGGDQPVISGTFSLTMWIYARGIPTAAGDLRMPLSNDTWADRAIHVHIMPETGLFNIDTKNGTDISSNTAIRANQWYHVAGTLDAAGESKIYINGVLDNSATGSAKEYLIGPANIGAYQESSRFFNGMIDDVRIYNHILSEAEIQELTIVSPPGAASTPSPADEATDVPRDVTLNWTPGEYAPAVNGHIVYLSNNFNEVNDGIGGITQSATGYDPGRLNVGTTYYWRVDEVNGAPDFAVHQGDVWSFTTEPFSYAIENVIATASSSSQGKGPENTVNGSGLDDSGLLHSNESQDNMWLSGVTGSQEPTWIAFEFDKVRKLHELWVWNSNDSFELAVGFGFKDVSVEYSVDGINYAILGTTHEFAQAPGTSDYAHNTTIDLGGALAKYVRLTANSNWGSSLSGLSEVRFFYTPVGAREPSPDSGATDVGPDVTFAWRAGREAATHDVYLSTDEQAVIDGTAPVTVLTEASHSPSPLDLGSTYYWRVDEVNDAETPTTWQGDIWSFSTQEFIVVDDFESYNDIDPPDADSNRIFEGWIDGYGVATNGALVGYDPPQPSYAETVIVHGGSQSMPIFYSNTLGVAFSEVTRMLAAQNWTVNGIKTLSLWFSGDPANVTGQLYVKVNGVKVAYDGDAGNLAVAAWQPWNIDLTSLGINLSNVTSLAIGIDGVGATGTLYVDDARLYSYERQLITPSDPGNAGLAAHYTLDQNAGDSSGNGHNGKVEGAATLVSPGSDGAGGCMKFGGDVDRITVESFDVTGSGITLSAWIKPSTFKDDARMISKSEGGGTNFHYWAMVLSGTGEDNLQFRLRTDVGNTTSRASAEGTEVQANEWTHVAVTWDAADPVMRQYKNGIEIDSLSKAGSVVATGAGVKIGIGNQSISAFTDGPANLIRPFDGLIDEVRVYERGLSVEQLRWLAGRTQPYDKPF